MTFSFISAPALVAMPVYSQANPGNPLATACQDQEVANKSAACQTAKNNGENPLYGKDGIIIKGAQIVALLTGIASIIVIMISGFRYVVSGGDPNSVNSAKNAILYSIIGLVIAITAELIVAFVVNKL